MGKRQKLIVKILSGRSDANIAFDDLVQLLIFLGFDRRQEGSHNVFTKTGIEERINLQEDSGKAKRYQVKQVRYVLTKYGLVDDE